MGEESISLLLGGWSDNSTALTINHSPEYNAAR